MRRIWLNKAAISGVGIEERNEGIKEYRRASRKPRAQHRCVSRKPDIERAVRRPRPSANQTKILPKTAFSVAQLYVVDRQRIKRFPEHAIARILRIVGPENGNRFHRFRKARMN